MNPDINSYYQAENDPQFQINIENSTKNEETTSQSQSEQKTTCGPKNELDWKVHDCGVNQIQSPPPIVFSSIKDRSVSHSLIYIIDAEAFKRYANWNAWHQNQLNQRAYIEERIEEDRENKEENLVQKPQGKEEISQEHIDIKRMDAA